MTDTTPQQSTTNTDYGDVLHSTILKIFGDVLTYNELKNYTKNPYNTSHLEVREFRNNLAGFMFMFVFIDKKKIMEKKYDDGERRDMDMTYFLEELKNETYDLAWEEEEEEEEEEDDEEKIICVVCGNKVGNWGHNPQPIKEDGICCDRCNQTVVIPARLLEASEREDEIDEREDDREVEEEEDDIMTGECILCNEVIECWYNYCGRCNEIAKKKGL
jgi:hypothetical protein